MDFTKAITYNGFTFQPPTPVAGAPLDGTQIRQARFANVEGVGYLDKRALDDGLDAVDVFLGGRTIEISASVYGSTEGRLYDNLADLMAAFDPTLAYAADSTNRGFIALDFYRPTADIVTWPTSAYANGIPQRILCRPTRIPTYDLSKANTGGVASKGGAIPVQISLVARDPRIYLQSQRTLSLSTSSQTAEHRGDHPSWAFVTIVMSGAGSSNVNIVTDGHTVGLNLSSVTTGTFSINYATRHVTDSSGTSRDDLLRSTWDQDWTAVQPGGSVVRLTNATNIDVTYAWRESWL